MNNPVQKMSINKAGVLGNETSEVHTTPLNLSGALKLFQNKFRRFESLADSLVYGRYIKIAVLQNSIIIPLNGFEKPSRN